jgi:drug/metabolite transporter (DMT)-like permease
MSLIIAGALVLTWSSEARLEAVLPALAILAACLSWAIDNNLTRKIALADAVFIAMGKGIAAGIVNLALALRPGAKLPPGGLLLSAGFLGFLSYGMSLVLFVIGLRHLGTARTSAYFSAAPFVGAFLSIPILGEPLTPKLIVAGFLMGWGVWLHLTELHEHEHTHEPLEHQHEHVHDEHHRHVHPEAVAPGTRHIHWHRHEPMTHTHPHYPDEHHRYRH